MNQDARGWRTLFLCLWVVLLALKLLAAARMPIFVDEAFYWQEGQHLAWAYSDLPGVTAWLTRVGVSLFGDTPLGLRWCFLLLGACVPWLVRALAAHMGNAQAAWQAGVLAMLLPLGGTLGVLALPDVPLTIAALLCAEAVAALHAAPTRGAVARLALGLALGALTHYRFAAVAGVGLLAWWSMPRGRAILRRPVVLGALALGALAWLPLVLWNLVHANAGLQFQLVDRHPWAFHASGAYFPLVQAMLATPILFAAALLGAWRARAGDGVETLTARLGGGLLLTYAALGFFADAERLSLHWPLPALLVLLVLVPTTWARWSRAWRTAGVALAALGLLAALALHAAIARPAWRMAWLGERFYPENFVGWRELDRAVRDALVELPVGTRVVADNFKLGATLGWLRGDADITVLDHPLNHHHGRDPQLRLWGSLSERRGDLGTDPLLLVLSPTDVKLRALAQRYADVCAWAGQLPPPRIVNVDGGRKRFLLLVLPAQDSTASAPGPCAAPAIAHIDAPDPGAIVRDVFEVRGWATKSGVGVRDVEVLLDGHRVAQARYGLRNDWVASFLGPASTDPQHPHVGFVATVQTAAIAPGPHRLNVRILGNDGSIESSVERMIEVTQ
jgi:hypothetical protein